MVRKAVGTQASSYPCEWYSIASRPFDCGDETALIPSCLTEAKPILQAGLLFISTLLVNNDGFSLLLRAASRATAKMLVSASCMYYPWSVHRTCYDEPKFIHSGFFL